MIYCLYEWHLLSGLKKLPGNLCFMITRDDLSHNPNKPALVTEWLIAISKYVCSHNPGCNPISGITFHIDTNDQGGFEIWLPALSRISSFAHLYLHYKDQIQESGSGMPVTIAIGKSGRGEIIDAIKKMADDEISPDELDDHLLESYLTFQYTPDFVIKTGASHLTDFLIWQSVYSELYFTDMDWDSMRRIDILRALRDYQDRIRRYGT
ncbi:MAG: undecaprenyl diphosphate synthase family protein [Methanospirillaceae archaeon]|nr:undecaprenyl diphosphate synthase family protein [Methanospirillaceae archaeon]